MPAKKDPNPGKLELRLSFFSSLIFSPSENPLNQKFQASGEVNHINRRFDYGREIGRIAAIQSRCTSDAKPAQIVHDIA